MTEDSKYGYSSSACTRDALNPWSKTANTNFGGDNGIERENGCIVEYDREWGYSFSRSNKNRKR